MIKIKYFVFYFFILFIPSFITGQENNHNSKDYKEKNISFTLFNSISSFNLSLFQQNITGTEVKAIYTPGGEEFALTTYGINLNLYNFSISLSKTFESFPSYFESEKVDPQIIKIDPIFSQKEWAIKLLYSSYKGFYLTQPELSDFYLTEKRRENLKYIETGLSFEFNLKPLLSNIVGKEIKNYFDFSKFYNYSYGTGFDYSQIKDLPVSAFFDVIGIIGGASVFYTKIKDDSPLIITPHNLTEGLKNSDSYHTEIYITAILPFANEDETFFGSIGFSTSLGICFGRAETSLKKENIVGFSARIPGFITFGYNILGYLIARVKAEYEITRLPLYNTNYLKTDTLKISLLITISL